MNKYDCEREMKIKTVDEPEQKKTLLRRVRMVRKDEISTRGVQKAESCTII